jgi:hypothetical protein
VGGKCGGCATKAVLLGVFGLVRIWPAWWPWVFIFRRLFCFVFWPQKMKARPAGHSWQLAYESTTSAKSADVYCQSACCGGTRPLRCTFWYCIAFYLLLPFWLMSCEPHRYLKVLWGGAPSLL